MEVGFDMSDMCYWITKAIIGKTELATFEKKLFVFLVLHHTLSLCGVLPANVYLGDSPFYHLLVWGLQGHGGI